MNNNEYKELYLNTSQLVVPRELYQRRFNDRCAQLIARNFDERIANEPKVSYRDGVYYVFDGQHTIAARKHLNGDEDLEVKCKVYFGLSAQEEALLFAQQTGYSKALSSGARLRALIAGNDRVALAFKAATEDAGIELDYDQSTGKHRLGCVRTAMVAYIRMGEARYKEAMELLDTAWGGAPDSYRSANITAFTRFVELYHGEYDCQRLLTRLARVDPLTIYREGQAMGLKLSGYKRYLYQVYRIYNSGKGDPLPLKF